MNGKRSPVHTITIDYAIPHSAVVSRRSIVPHRVASAGAGRHHFGKCNVEWQNKSSHHLEQREQVQGVVDGAVQ